MKAGNEGDTAPEHPRLERRLVERGAAHRSAAKGLDETLNAQNNQLAKFVFAHEIQGVSRLEPHLVERIAARHQVGKSMLTVKTGVNHLAGFPDGSNRGLEAGQSVSDWTRPQDRHLHEKVCARLLCGEPVSFGKRDCQPCKSLPVCEAMEHWAKDYGERAVADIGVLACAVATGQLHHPERIHLEQFAVDVIGQFAY